MLKRIILILYSLYIRVSKILTAVFAEKIRIYRYNKYVKWVFSKKRLDNLKSEILKYYSTLPQDKISTELSSAVDFLKHNPVFYFPCNLTRKYNAEMVHLAFDHETKLYFATINGKRMFFKRGWTESECIKYCYCIQEEQDENSPHRYLSENFTVQDGDIVVDIGTAEGIFSLDVIEKAGKVYLFEADSGWNEALKATFAPWKEKVEIVNKYLSDEVNNNNTTIDSFFQNKKRPDFIKIDVDGAEAKVIKGCNQLLSTQHNLKMAICTYHKQEDELFFSELLKEKGFHISFSKGFFLYINDELHPPYFRRGVLRAVK
ncbi:MAG: FkbM family methyltransferase [Bacteroidales bacterium]|nr:FkbM family methyltransferase [Bacteroidales bacterium]